MAFSNKPFDFEYDPPMIQTKDYAIGGKLVHASYVLSEMRSEIMPGSEIKSILAQDLVNYIIENKLVEFTKIDNPIDLSVKYNARLYLATSDQIKILRTYGK